MARSDYGLQPVIASQGWKPCHSKKPCRGSCPHEPSSPLVVREDTHHGIKLTARHLIL
jgi:hypothetical protein